MPPGVAQVTAVTANASVGEGQGAADVAQAVMSPQRGDELVVGSWSDDNTCRGRDFDTLLVDYLLGAMDAFTPYTQDLLFPRLARHARHGAVLHVVGLSPIPHGRAFGRGAQLVVDAVRLRDACMLLAGQRFYREYPAEWVLRHLEQAGWSVGETQHFDVIWRPRMLHLQLGAARHKLRHFKHAATAAAMRAAISELEDRAEDELGDGVIFGTNYLVHAHWEGPPCTAK